MNNMSRRSFIGGTLAVAGGTGVLVNLFSRAGDEPVVKMASAAAPEPSACTVSVSSAQPDSTQDLVNVVRAYLRDAGLLQDFTSAEHFHKYMVRVYDDVIAAEDAEDELGDAYEKIVEDSACHTPDMPTEPNMDKCKYSEAWKLFAHLEALQIYPADGSRNFDTLNPIEQYKVSNATVAFANLVTNFYPTLANDVWPDGVINGPIGALWVRTEEQEYTLAGNGVCIKPMPAPVEVAPAAPEQTAPIAPNGTPVRNTPGLVLRA